MIQRREVFHNIQPQHVAVLSAKLLETLHRPMRPLTYPVSVAVGDKAPLKKRLDHIAQGMMYHPVTGNGGAALIIRRLGSWI